MLTRIYYSLSLLAALFLAGSASAADSLAVRRQVDRSVLLYKAALEQTGMHTFRPQIWQNSAIRYDLRTYSLTSVDLSGSIDRRGAASLAQEGNRRRDLRVDIRSFVALNDRERLFGEAGYRNGRRDNVQWNENSDYNLIYPYVVGDSIGGWMNEEEYRFGGTYVRRLHRWRVGIGVHYRAMTAYRDKDPRPRNTVSDLQAGVSAALQPGADRHILALALRGRKYSQQTNIAFLADKGSSSVYQMIGMGMDYVRFAGAQTSTRHTGLGIGGSIDWMPANRQGRNNGLSASLKVDYLHLTKRLPNANYAPINEVKQTDIALETAWTQETMRWQRAVGLTAAYGKRTGIENIFGDPAAGVYPQLSSISQYTNTTLTALLTARIGQPTEAIGNRLFGWNVEPAVGYDYLKPEYKGNQRFMELSTLQGTLKAQLFVQLPRWLLTATAGGGYSAALAHDYSLPGLNAASSVGVALYANYRYLSDNCFTAHIALRADYAIGTRYALTLSARWRHDNYQTCGTSNRGEVAVGVLF
jgi:hypothetical protein